MSDKERRLSVCQECICVRVDTVQQIGLVIMCCGIVIHCYYKRVVTPFLCGAFFICFGYRARVFEIVWLYEMVCFFGTVR